MLTPSCWAKILHIQIIYEMTPPHRHSRAFDPSCFIPYWREKLRSQGRSHS